ncbi:MAG TPA: HEAT repeat domain-containing protein [Thermoanaerobaculia bacterium]|nr:HEAT repeat domain-containing protein [Thermoanaerobaculia bacterium]
MNIQDYRREVEERIEREAAEEEESDAALASAAPDDEVSEVRQLAKTAREDEAGIQRLFEILKNAGSSEDARRAALAVLRLFRFNSQLLNEKRAELIDALRTAVENSSGKLLDEVLETLAQEKDEYAQRRLLEGLTGKSEPLVPTARAIQLLGYDIHAEHFPLLRELAQKSDDPATRREAVRLLSADPSSAPLLMDIFQKKEESADVRRASANALVNVAPQEFEQKAKEVALDESDADSVRAASLTALAHFGNPTDIAEDTAFVDKVEQIETAAPDAALASAAPEGVEVEEGELEKALRTFKTRHRRK